MPLKNWLAKFAWIIVVFSAYSFIVNPMRVYINSELVRPAFDAHTLANRNIKVTYPGPKFFAFDWRMDQEKWKNSKYKSPFGMFWGVGMVILILVSAPKKYYLILNLLHLFTGITAVVFVLLGATHHVYLFLVSDFAIEYLAPVGSLVLAPLAYIESVSKNKIGTT